MITAEELLALVESSYASILEPAAVTGTRLRVPDTVNGQ
jgi:hypothetical protein